MKNTTNHQKVLNLTFIALFAALCYIVLSLLFIPFANMYIHFGNLVVVLASLLVGGIQGGLAGAVGMSLFDMFNGHIDSAPKTFVLKFLIGITVGLVYCFFKKRKKFPSLTLLISGFFSLIISCALIISNAVNKDSLIGSTWVLAPLFIFIGILCIAFSFLKFKLSQKTASAVIGATCGMLVNILGESLWKTVQFLLAGSNLTAALSAAVLSQGSTLINAAIAIIGGVALYIPLEKPFAKILNK